MAEKKEPKKFRYADLDSLKRDRPYAARLHQLKAPEKALRFGNPAEPNFEKNIVQVFLPGFGENGRSTAPAKVHCEIAPVLMMAFQEIASLGLDYELRPFGDHATYCLRYGKSTKNANMFTADPDYASLSKKSWNVDYAKFDLDHGRFGKPIGGENVPRWHHLSNHSWGTAVDINPSTNPMKSGAYFDMPEEIVRVMCDWGFFWGGYFSPPDGDYMHFEFVADEIRTSSFRVPAPHVVFPLGSEDKRESPTKYFHINESGAGGFYPLGACQDLHGGVHLYPSPPAPPVSAPAPAASPTAEAPAAAAAPPPAMPTVRATLPGYIVAARLVRMDCKDLDKALYSENQLLQDCLQHQPLGFVLIRHELIDTADPGKSAPFYSLYMHLDAPDWDRADGRFEAAPWLEKLLRMRYGGVVALDPSNHETLGKTFWATEKFDAKGTGPVPVRGLPQPLPRKDGERRVGFGKPTPVAIDKAIAALRTGAVITFDRQVLPVGRGEVIGFLDGGASSRYLHWEIFAPPGQGLKKLRDKAQAFGVTFDDPLEELHEDNFLETKSRHTPQADNEVESAFASKNDPVLSPAIKPNDDGLMDGYATRLARAYQSGEAFAKDSKAGPTFRFTYPATLRFANSFNFKPEAGVPHMNEVTVTFLRNGQSLKQETKTIPSFDAHITLDLDVPAGADAVTLKSPYFRLELSPPPPPPPPPGQTPEQAKQASEKRKNEREKLLKDLNAGRWELLRSVTGRRWRNVVLKHINEWNSKNLTPHVKSLLAAKYVPKVNGEAMTDVAEIVKLLTPMSWWAPDPATSVPHGEQPAAGGESRFKSLFDAGAGFLPFDGQVENMHPVTALWMLDLLQEEKAITLVDKADHDGLFAEPAGQKPMFLGLVTPAGEPRVGENVTLALIHHGYGSSHNSTDEGVAFLAVPDDHPPILLHVAGYVDGAAVIKERFPFWRETKIKAESRKNKEKEGSALEPDELGVTTLDLPRPSLSGAEFTFAPVAKSPNWVGSFIARENCPYALEGYLSFECWTADHGKKADFTVPGTPGKCLLPVVANRFPPEENVRDGLVFEGEFILNKAPAGVKKWSAKTARVSTSYVLQDFIGRDPEHPVAKAEPGRFKLGWQLVQRLQALRDECRRQKKGDKTTGFEITQLAESGLTATLQSRSIAAILDRASQLPASALFTIGANPDETLNLTYSPAPTTGTLSFTVDPSAALQQLANDLCTKNGQQLFARPS